MVKDYFQDITPPSGDSNSQRQFTPRPPVAPQPIGVAQGEHEDVRDIPIRVGGAIDSQNSIESVDPAARGIRSISAPQRTRPMRADGAPNRMDMDIRESSPVVGGVPSRPPHRSSRLWLWAAASVVLLCIIAAAFFLFASTTITVTPKSRTAVLTSVPLTAEEGTNAPAGTLSYTLQIFDLEDSEVVEAQGMTHVETKSSGSITVSNAYSASPVTLVKNTRFESPGGLIFRVLSDVVIPGKKGSTVGTIDVAVVADQVGEKYNIEPTAKFTLPGLKSTPAMYTGVYAKSVTAMSGGLLGDQPGTAPGALEAAIALVRGRLETKAHEAAAGQAKEDTSTFPDLMVISYESLPNTSEASNSIRIHQKAHVEIPVFPAEAFAQAIAQAAFTDREEHPLSLKPSPDFSVHALALSEDAGEDKAKRLNLVASGSTLIVWKVDVTALGKALEGKDSSAFQGIVNGFPGIQEAHARILPFWRNTFPAKTDDIQIKITEPAATQ